MSRVVHLSNDAHQQAKEFCNRRGLRMSDWVGELIASAVTKETPAMALVETAPSAPTSLAAKKKPLTVIEDTPQCTSDGLPLYAAPPFWMSGSR
jgi:hypothetical protein